MSDGREPAHKLVLRVLPLQLAVCYLSPDAALPTWATGGAFFSVSRTDDELSVVCDFEAVPPDIRREGPWACLEVEGPLDFSLTGILAGLAAPLADANISIFAISTYRTDYVLVPATDIRRATKALQDCGYTLRDQVDPSL